MDKKDFWETLESIFFNGLTRNGWVVENEKTKPMGKGKLEIIGILRYS